VLVTPNQFETINQEFIEDLISFKTEEDIHLEYKENLISSEKIAKTLSSLANTEGGNVFFGIREDKNKPVDITPISIPKTKEKIDRVARTGISPPLYIRILPVDIEKEDKKGQVFVIYVPKKYPYIHFAKKAHRFYKRSEANSIPMEEYEIREAYRLQSEHSERIYDNIYEVEKMFRSKIGVHRLSVSLITWPSIFGPKLFSIGEEMTEFFDNNIPEVPTYRFLNLFFPDTRDRRNRIGQDYYIFKPSFFHVATALFKTNGITIYSLQFDFAKRNDEKDYVRKDDFKTGKFGLVDEGDKEIKLELIVYCLITYLSFLHKFYTAVNYWGGITLRLDINNIQIWHDINGRNFSDQQFTPVENFSEVLELSDANIEIIEKLINPLLNGYGWSEGEKNDFFQNIKNRLEHVSKE